jgi:hypothetical protein
LVLGEPAEDAGQPWGDLFETGVERCQDAQGGQELADVAGGLVRGQLVERLLGDLGLAKGHGPQYGRPLEWLSQ